MRKPTKAVFRTIHRYLGVTLGGFWLLQSISGAILAFHRPIDDWLLGASHQPVDFQLVDGAVREFEQNNPGMRVVEYFVSGGSTNHIDLLVQGEDGQQVILRIDGSSGLNLRKASWTTPIFELSPFRFILLFHKQLLAGTLGTWIVGFSGAFLASTLALGIALGWPFKSTWRRIRALPRLSRNPTTFYAWHRSIGMSLAPLGLFIALTGALLVWIPTPYDPGPSKRQIRTSTFDVTPPITAREAITIAQSQFKTAAFSSVSMPTKARTWYSVRLRQPGEVRRTFGTTFVFVDSTNGNILKTVDALKQPMSRKLTAALWPLHTGEWGSTFGRTILLMGGFWLMTTAGLGLGLWWLRKRPSTSRPQGLSRVRGRSTVAKLS